MAKKTQNKKPLKAKVSAPKHNNLALYNQARSSVSAYLKESGKPYTAKDLSGNTSAIYRKIKKVSKTDSVLRAAFKNIDILIDQHFAVTNTSLTKIEDFDWWRIQEFVGDLPQDAYIIVDNSEVLINSTVMEWEGPAYNFDRIFPVINNDMNVLYQRKGYAYYYSYLFRDDSLNKEFVYYLLLDEADERRKFEEDEIKEWIENNKITDIASIYARIPNETDKNKSAYNPNIADAMKSIEARFEAELNKPSTPPRHPAAPTDEELMARQKKNKKTAKKKVVKKKTSAKKVAKKTTNKKPASKAPVDKGISQKIELEKQKQKTIGKVLELVKAGFTKKEINKILGL